MKNRKIVFFGTPDFVITVLDALHRHFTIVGVITTPDAPLGRKQKLTPSPIKERALQLNLPVFTPQKLDDELIRELTTVNCELIVVASYGKIIPQSLLDVPSQGAINIHPSLLPKYRGATPVPAVILNGETETGISFIQIDSQMDHGPVIYQEKFRLTGQETSQSLLKEIWQKAAELAPQIISDFTGGKIEPRLQDHAIASYCNLMSKEGGYFEIDNPPAPEVLDRMIRGYFPWPTAWTRWKGKIVKLLPDTVNPDIIGVNCGPRTVNYLVQLEGKNPIPLKDFLNGYPDFPLKNL
ncbi:methionyl-tRNA formyltransferase [Candidatus Daviesbacteria bacterium RIFCSPHIGHO2_01_FULL_44_29]|uniref:Methionyl-tRNA formyltransferase n=1 Tax=Candidatus Daviesbacteria bacterium RIFCSPHIGHO2_02_FULL_43_12 TaxID=1797776 RepID=A0A1F5KKV1_9BACT|nr:MAG: methionyl-tRNA formyltransferase [Candidatus Daviesbacteria bacterium RIFCSPHIGHO2_01_FULL_44_29]OGE39683.1 MAG: methionyl-tRNA formyltransferase [Candidatus Daviesbacteria bacterium RIFCSPHIGHO2_12_FULL_47_45]OGE41543.1 MAG: methionyl-tRNA formyltransferase [Candidatus Daviesbacteria bacterium RIFCSPHIGHO2_02_FULL_43_12]OGE69825.1 MAG: methionyl-tRNA formyltransferase [Candidatus Daviesbacteria bacterium RIFCSPLOWO2_01_FULL_43_15]